MKTCKDCKFYEGYSNYSGVCTNIKNRWKEWIYPQAYRDDPACERFEPKEEAEEQ